MSKLAQFLVLITVVVYISCINTIQLVGFAEAAQTLSEVCTRVNATTTATVVCPKGYISQTLFASYGNPLSCYQPGLCHKEQSQAIVSQTCLPTPNYQTTQCILTANDTIFPGPFVNQLQCTGQNNTNSYLYVRIQCANNIPQPPSIPVQYLFPGETRNLSLRGTDADGDGMVNIITRMPAMGAIFQYDTGVPITTAGTSLTDANFMITYTAFNFTTPTMVSDVIRYQIMDSWGDASSYTDVYLTIKYCQNGVLDSRTGRCNCSTNWAGEYCHIECVNGAIDDFLQKCVCHAGWSGPICNTALGGFALDFDGVDDYITVGNSSILSDFRVSNQFTLETFVYVLAIQPHNAVIFGTTVNGTNGRIELELGLIGGTNRLYCTLGSNTYTPLPAEVPSIALNAWQYVAVTYTGSNITFVTGTTSFSSTSSPIMVAGVTPALFSDYTSGSTGEYRLHIGARVNTNGTISNGFRGIIEETRVWREAKSANHFANYMSRHLRAVETNLTAYYQYNERSGNITTDLGVNGNNGSLALYPSNPSWTVSTVVLTGVLVRYVTPEGPYPTSGFNVTVVGENFGSDPNSISARLGDLRCQNFTFIVPDHSFRCSFFGGSGSNVQLVVDVADAYDKRITSNNDIFFSYEPPGLTSVTPNATVSEASTIVINGTNFGESANKLSARVDRFSCTNIRVLAPHVSISCLVEGTGKDHQVYVEVDGQESTQTWGPKLSFNPPEVYGVIYPSERPTVGYTITVYGINFGRDSTVLSVDAGANRCTGVQITVPHRNFTCFVGQGTGTNNSIVVNVDKQNSSAANFIYDNPFVQRVSANLVTGYPTSGAPITITGKNFGSWPQRVSVTVGGRNCPITALTHVSITCTLPTGGGVNNSVSVVVDGLSSNGNATVTYDVPTVTSIISPTGYPTSGVRLTISGTNFGDDPSRIQVFALGHNCSNVQVLIAHRTVACTVVEGYGVNHNVTLLAWGQLAPSSPASRFSYDPPTVTAMDPPRPPTVGANVTIYGTNFGAFNSGAIVSVTIGGQLCRQPQVVVSHAQIRCVLGQGTGVGKLIIVTIQGQVSSQTISISYQAPVLTGRRDTFAIAYNGVYLDLYGTNFGTNNSLVKVWVDAVPCEGVTILANHTSLRCKLGMSSGLNLPITMEVDGLPSSAPLSISYYATAPQIYSFVFADTLDKIVATFTQPVNLDGMRTAFPCSVIFTNVTTSLFGDDQECTWQNETVLNVVLGGTATVLVGDWLFINPGVLRHKDFPHLILFETSSQVLAPLNPIRPTLIVNSPIIVGECDGLLIDCSLSYGGGPRELQFFYSVEDPTGTANLTLLLPFVSALRNRTIIIPKSMMRVNEVYLFKIRAMNYVGFFSDSTTIKVEMMIGYPPVIYIQGPRERALEIGAPNEISAIVRSSVCAPPSSVIKYEWSMGKGANVDPFFEFDAKTKDTPYLYIPPGSLRYGYQYPLVLTAVADNFYETNTRVLVTTKLRSIVARIRGANRLASINQNLVLDALVYDPDSTSSTPVCYWKSATILIASRPMMSLVVGTTQLADQFTRQKVYVHTFSLSCTKDGRSSSDVAQVTLTDKDVPSIFIEPLRFERLSNMDALTLEATTFDQNLLVTNYTWEEVDNKIDLKTYEEAYLTTTASAPYISIRPGILSNYTMYTFRVNTTDAATGVSGYAYISVNINLPPVSGSCSISPTTGIAMQTKFSIHCNGHYDDDVPLSYMIYYQVSNTSEPIPLGHFDNQYLDDIFLPPGDPSSGSTITLLIYVSDLFGSARLRTLLATVTPDLQPTADAESPYLVIRNMITNAMSISDFEAAIRMVNAAVFVLRFNNGSITTNQNALLQSYLFTTLNKIFSKTHVDSVMAGKMAAAFALIAADTKNQDGSVQVSFATFIANLVLASPIEFATGTVIVDTINQIINNTNAFNSTSVEQKRQIFSSLISALSLTKLRMLYNSAPGSTPLRVVRDNFQVVSLRVPTEHPLALLIHFDTHNRPRTLYTTAMINNVTTTIPAGVINQKRASIAAMSSAVSNTTIPNSLILQSNVSLPAMILHASLFSNFHASNPSYVDVILSELSVNPHATEPASSGKTFFSLVTTLQVFAQDASPSTSMSSFPSALSSNSLTDPLVAVLPLVVNDFEYGEHIFNNQSAAIFYGRNSTIGWQVDHELLIFPEGNKTRNITHMQVLSCLYWTETNGVGSWETDGCRIGEITTNYVHCICDFLRDFHLAVAMSEYLVIQDSELIPNPPPPPTPPPVIPVITNATAFVATPLFIAVGLIAILVNEFVEHRKRNQIKRQWYALIRAKRPDTTKPTNEHAQGSRSTTEDALLSMAVASKQEQALVKPIDKFRRAVKQVKKDIRLLKLLNRTKDTEAMRQRSKMQLEHRWLALLYVRATDAFSRTRRITTITTLLLINCMLSAAFAKDYFFYVQGDPLLPNETIDASRATKNFFSRLFHVIFAGLLVSLIVAPVGFVISWIFKHTPKEVAAFILKPFQMLMVKIRVWIRHSDRRFSSTKNKQQQVSHQSGFGSKRTIATIWKQAANNNTNPRDKFRAAIMKVLKEVRARRYREKVLHIKMKPTHSRTNSSSIVADKIGSSDFVVAANAAAADGTHRRTATLPGQVINYKGDVANDPAAELFTNEIARRMYRTGIECIKVSNFPMAAYYILSASKLDPNSRIKLKNKEEAMAQAIEYAKIHFPDKIPVDASGASASSTAAANNNNGEQQQQQQKQKQPGGDDTAVGGDQDELDNIDIGLEQQLSSHSLRSSPTTVTCSSVGMTPGRRRSLFTVQQDTLDTHVPPRTTTSDQPTINNIKKNKELSKTSVKFVVPLPPRPVGGSGSGSDDHDLEQQQQQQRCAERYEEIYDEDLMDMGTGTSQDPYKGLQFAADNAQPGDLIIVREGRYSPFTITTSGSKGSPIIFLGQGAVIDGTSCDKADLITVGTPQQPVKYIRLEGLIFNNGTNGVNLQYADNVVVQKNTFINVALGLYGVFDLAGHEIRFTKNKFIDTPDASNTSPSSFKTLHGTDRKKRGGWQFLRQQQQLRAQLQQQQQQQQQQMQQQLQRTSSVTLQLQALNAKKTNASELDLFETPWSLRQKRIIWALKHLSHRWAVLNYVICTAICIYCALQATFILLRFSPERTLVWFFTVVLAVLLDIFVHEPLRVAIAGHYMLQRKLPFLPCLLGVEDTYRW